MLSHLRSAWRTHSAQPSFAVVAALILAIGIGANTTVFSVANTVLLKSLPYPDPDRLVAIFESRPREQRDEGAVSIADFLDWREQNSTFSAMAAYDGTSYSLTGVSDPEQAAGAVVSGHFFDTLGVRPLLGRVFGPEAEQSGGDRLIVLSHGFWQRRFGGDRSVIGRVITLNGWPQTIIGVLPPEFVPPARMWELFGPLKFDAAQRNARAIHNLNVVARLKPGTSIGAARQEMDLISKRLESSFTVNRGHYANVLPFDEAQRGKLRPAMIVLVAAVGLVLFIACFNVANLFLARSVARAREMSIRLAIGASRRRIAGQLLVESLTLSMCGAAVAVLGTMWAVEYVRRIIPDQLGLAAADIQIDSFVLFFAVALSILSSLVSGLAPAFIAARGSVNEVLRSGGRQQTEPGWRQWQRAAIVAGQMALSVLLLVGAGLLVRSFVKLLEVDPGFRPERVLTMGISLPYSTYREDAKKIAFQKGLLEKIRLLPGVLGAGMTSFLPVTGQNSRMGLVVDGIEPDRGEPRRANYRMVSPGYFETMQIPLRQGRLFADSDQSGAPIAMVINESAAKKYWPGRDPVGTQARLVTMKSWAVVVGVVGDVKHWGLEKPVAPEAYLSLYQAPFWLNNLVVRTHGDPMDLAQEVRRQLWSLDKDLPPAAIRSMQEVIDQSTALRRFYVLLLTGLAGTAVLLAGVGIYAQLAYGVSQRMREIGLRMALGARRSDMVRLVAGEGMRISLAGAVVGLAAALGLVQLLEKLLFGVTPLDPITLAASLLILLAVAALACVIPSWRASKADPAVALRYE